MKEQRKVALVQKFRVFPNSPLALSSHCRSRLADFFTNCQPESRSASSCLKENYADCLLAYSGLIGKTGEKRDGREVWLTNTHRLFPL